jgi:hypothetical protein
MNRIIRAATVALAFACVASAQVVTRPESDNRRKYEVVCAYDVSAAVPSLTIHVPATITGTKLRFGAITARTPAAADVIFEWGGATPSGGTTAAVRKQNTATAHTATVKCNATSATPTLSKTMKLPTVDTDYVFIAGNDEFLAGPLSGRTLRIALSTAVTGTGVIAAEISEGP